MEYLKLYWREIVIGVLLVSSIAQWGVFFLSPKLTIEQWEVLAEDDVWLRTQIIPLLQQNVRNGVLDPIGFEPFEE